VRIYSVETASFGRVLRARPIKAAHCLTTLQFSPTSQHLLLAYGRCALAAALAQERQVPIMQCCRPCGSHVALVKPPY
jgi:hypothetical protein